MFDNICRYGLCQGRKDLSHWGAWHPVNGSFQPHCAFL